MRQSSSLLVVICFHFSIFEPLETAPWRTNRRPAGVVICFHFSIFEPLETAINPFLFNHLRLWFAFILVSLNHWKQLTDFLTFSTSVVICFHFSIFEPLETAFELQRQIYRMLWFAFILVSLNHWKQLTDFLTFSTSVVICFHFSIFEPLETAVP